MELGELVSASSGLVIERPPGYVHLGLPGTSHEIGPRDHEGRTH